ncbi:hypothetical protein CapIbe_010259 [Capra ibex]
MLWKLQLLNHHYKGERSARSSSSASRGQPCWLLTAGRLLAFIQRNILTSTGGSGEEPRNMSIPRRRLGPRKAKYLYDEA